MRPERRGCGVDTAPAIVPVRALPLTLSPLNRKADRHD